LIILWWLVEAVVELDPRQTITVVEAALAG
jgi:hypothetical protein